MDDHKSNNHGVGVGTLPDSEIAVLLMCKTTAHEVLFLTMAVHRVFLRKLSFLFV